MVEKKRASLGGLLRRSMCRWREGRALKKEQPGRRRVWMIIGLWYNLSGSRGGRGLIPLAKENGWGERRGNVH